jgi:flagellar hook-basal body complex protein FliE
MPIDPTAAVASEWRIEPIAGGPAKVDGAAPEKSGGGGFADLLGGALEGLAASQTEAAQAAQALATGQAADPTAVVMAVERAQLSMQLASQIRTKAVEAAQDIFHTQV